MEERKKEKGEWGRRAKGKRIEALKSIPEEELGQEKMEYE